jgi:hypothetical protein
VNKDPLELAIRKISETRHMLQLLIISSESFDYQRAKTAIGDLQLKLQELARLQVELKGHRVTPRGVIEFPVLQQD